MTKDSGQPRTRRELFTAVLRYATLGLLGTVGGSVLAKRHRLVREGRCINRGICRGCDVFDRCGLPQALSAKQVLASRSDGGK